jgi:hypothetical protein
MPGLSCTLASVTSYCRINLRLASAFTYPNCPIVPHPRIFATSQTRINSQSLFFEVPYGKVTSLSAPTMLSAATW